MNQTLMQGACRYMRCNRLTDAGEALRPYGQRPLLLHGQRALAAVEADLLSLLNQSGMKPVFWLQQGFCSRNQLQNAIGCAREAECDCVIAVGGGKCMDLGKAVAAGLQAPIITVPTIAATCAAVTPFSVMYDDDGRPDGAIYHASPVELCIACCDQLMKAPEHFLRAGMVDSLAKLPELCSGAREGDDAPFFLQTARNMARYITDTLLPKCVASARGIGAADDAVIDAVIPLTGTCSGYAAGTSQLAIAHAFNSAVRKLHPQQANRFLHGETVGVGILIQRCFNGEGEIGDMQRLLHDLGMPCCISDLDMNAEGIAAYIADHMGFAKGSLEESRLQSAVIACV